MMRITLIPLVFLLSASAWAQDDTVEFNNDREPINGRITKMTYETVVIEILIGEQYIAQNLDSPKIKTITLNVNNKGYDVNRGESKKQSGDYDDAIKILRNVYKSPNVSKPAKQFAFKFLVEAYVFKGDDAGAAHAIQLFRRTFPKTYFLLWTYKTSFEIARRKEDRRGMASVVNEFKKKADDLGYEPWQKTGQIMQAEMHEINKEWRDALTIHKRLTRDSNVGDQAKLGELRCMSALKDGSLFSKADSIIRSFKGKARPNYRLLMGAYNARGDTYFAKGDTKSALLDYMRVVVVLGPHSAESTPEHESGLGKATIAAARFASEQKDAAKKDEYKARAEKLLKELSLTYGKGSGWFAPAKKAVDSVK